MTNRPDNVDHFIQSYDTVDDWHKLSWAHEGQTLFLADICHKRKPGKALDIGCGTGTDSIFLANEGWDVTSLDFVPAAIKLTEKRAKEAGASINPVVADVLEWEAPHKYDLVLDHGLLHNMHPANHARYREKLFQAMSDDADFVIVSWLKKHPSEPVTMVGPNRASEEEMKAFFAPEMTERYFAVQEKGDLPWFVGSGMAMSYYWFTPNYSFRKPAELVSQIKSTLDKQGFDYESAISDAGDGLAEANLMPHAMALIVGPGRLAMSQTVIKREEASAVISSWAKQSGEDAHYMENLLRVFGSKDHGKVCTDMPKCDVCQVSFCSKKWPNKNVT